MGRSVTVLVGVRAMAMFNENFKDVRKSQTGLFRTLIEENWRPSAMHLEKTHWIIDNSDLFIGEGTPMEEWCLLYKQLTRYSIGELSGESVRKDLMARYDRFVRSIE